jgi:16S rRNA (cytosine1402-N4)-methyltransferase
MRQTRGQGTGVAEDRDVIRPVSQAAGHQPAMVAEVVEWLQPRPGAVFVDGTVGAGGHSAALAPRLLPDGRLLGVDRDPDALALARTRLAEFEPQVILQRGNFRRLPALLAGLGWGPVNGLLLDLGMSSVQVDGAERGFSFLREGPLDMRMNPEQDTTAASLVNALPAEELEELLSRLGEERFARRIARRIVEARRRGALTTTTALARVVTEAVPPGARHGRLHAATRTFQALRMTVNDELGALEELLGALPDVLAPGGRAVILTFHSLEDRLVKQAFQRLARESHWALLTKKPLRPTAAETAANPRARSAKLRAVERG